MGKPILGNARIHRSEYIWPMSDTRGSETSQYPLEKKINNDSLSSGERTGKSLNLHACMEGLRDRDMVSVRIAERTGKFFQRG